MNATIDLLKAHRSIRKFSDRPIDDRTLSTIIAAAQCAATSHFVQAYTIIRVRDRRTRETIAQLAGPQVWVARAPVFLVFCADLNRLEAACRRSGVDMEKGWAEQFVIPSGEIAVISRLSLCVLMGMEEFAGFQSFAVVHSRIGLAHETMRDLDIESHKLTKFRTLKSYT